MSPRSWDHGEQLEGMGQVQISNTPTNPPVGTASGEKSFLVCRLFDTQENKENISLILADIPVISKIGADINHTNGHQRHDVDSYG